MSPSRRQLAGTNSTTQRRHRPDYQIILYMGLLMLIGLIIIYAIGPQRANVLNNSFGTDYADSYFFVKQAASLLLAIASFTVLSLVPFSFWKRHANRVLLVGLAACALLAIVGLMGLGLAQCSYGACRWFSLGPLGSFQPAEIVKFGVLLFAALFLGRRYQQNQVNNIQKTLIPLAIVMAVAMFFIVIAQKDLGTGVSLVAILAAMLVAAGLKPKIGLIIAGIIAVAGVLSIITAPHRLERVATFMQGDNVSTDNADNYHIAQAKIAIGSGGLAGLGIGNSVQATGYLPESINDSVFAIMGETFGFIGLAVILALFTALLLRLLKVSDHLVEPSMRFLVAGVFGWLATHVVLNVGAMIGVVPLTGITLPLLSFGGTSMIFIAGVLGLTFQLSRYTQHRSHYGEGKEKTRYESFGSRRGLGRPRYTSRRRSA